MPIIYITGVEGSGKSTISKALNKYGYSAIDIDEQGLSKRYLKGSWKLTKRLPNSGEISDTWYKEREWKVKPVDLGLIKKQAGAKPSFVCGITDNFNEICNIFDKVICLFLSQDDILLRLKTRTNNTFGKNAPEQHYILNKYLDYEAINRNFGSIMIDASQPLDMVLEAILSATK